MRFAPLLLAAGIAPAVFAQPVDTAQSQIHFALKQMGVSVEGSFAQFNATVDFHTDRPQAAKADIIIRTASIALPTDDASKQARQMDWFNAGQFPSARFVSTAFQPIGDGRFLVKGKLTIKGITQDVSAPFLAKAQANGLVVDGALPISRLAFHVGDGEWSDTSVIADAVQVKFHLVLKGT